MFSPTHDFFLLRHVSFVARWRNYALDIAHFRWHNRIIVKVKLHS